MESGSTISGAQATPLGLHQGKTLKCVLLQAELRQAKQELAEAC